jgi:DNA-directed RNA polymerase specialized sigma24 family protein
VSAGGPDHHHGAPLSPADQQRWTVLYRRFHGPLVTHARRHGADPDLAEDATHEALLLVLLERPRRLPSSARLAGLVVQRVASHLAVRRREVSLATAPEVAVSGPDADVYLDPRVTTVARALARLSAEDQALLDLHLDDWTASELAELLGVPADQVDPLVTRALHRARAALQDLADRLAAFPGTVVAAVRRAWAATHRAHTGLADQVAASWLRLDPTHAVSVLLGSAAAGLSLVVAAGVGTSALFPRRDAPAVTVEATSVASSDGNLADAPVAATAPGPARRADGGLPFVRVAPAIAAQPEEGQTNYTVTPVRAAVPQPGDDKTQYRHVVTAPLVPPVGFECPAPGERPPVPALGCPVLEAVS